MQDPNCKKKSGNFLLQQHLEKFVGIVHECSVEEKASFIEDNYWIWDNRVEYEWTPGRIRYYRKLHAAIMRDFPASDEKVYRFLHAHQDVLYIDEVD